MLKVKGFNANRYKEQNEDVVAPGVRSLLELSSYLIPFREYPFGSDEDATIHNLIKLPLV